MTCSCTCHKSCSKNSVCCSCICDADKFPTKPNTVNEGESK